MNLYLFIQNKDSNGYVCENIGGVYETKESAIVAVFSKLNPLEPELLDTIPYTTMLDELEGGGVNIGFLTWEVYGGITSL